MLPRYNVYLQLKKWLFISVHLSDSFGFLLLFRWGFMKAMCLQIWMLWIFPVELSADDFYIHQSFWSHALRDPLDLIKFKRDLAPPSIARRSLARSGLVLHVLAGEYRHQLGQMVSGTAKESSWRKYHDRTAETTHQTQVVRGSTPTHTEGRTDRHGVCYITEVEGLHCLISQGDLQLRAVIVNTHMQTHMFSYK